MFVILEDKRWDKLAYSLQYDYFEQIIKWPIIFITPWPGK